MCLRLRGVSLVIRHVRLFILRACECIFTHPSRRSCRTHALITNLSSPFDASHPSLFSAAWHTLIGGCERRPYPHPPAGVWLGSVPPLVLGCPVDAWPISVFVGGMHMVRWPWCAWIVAAAAAANWDDGSSLFYFATRNMALLALVGA